MGGHEGRPYTFSQVAPGRWWQVPFGRTMRRSRFTFRRALWTTRCSPCNPGDLAASARSRGKALFRG